VSQSSELCSHNSLCRFSTSVYCCCLFRYRLSPETFGYTVVQPKTCSRNWYTKCRNRLWSGEEMKQKTV